MELGCFSVSLAVKNLQESKKFYEALGFSVFHGMEDQGWLIMKNGITNVGLFQGMFEKNIMTFNPGWDHGAQPTGDFNDVREIQKDLESKGIQLLTKVTEGTSGPASIMLEDPDGNPILIDQHVN